MAAALMASFEKRFRPAIHAELRLPANGVTVLFGPSGAGKTTILRCLAGLDRPEHGQIHYGDETWFDATKRIWLPPHKRQIGYLFQEYALFPHLTVAQNIAYGAEKFPRSERQQRMAEMLRWAQLSDLKDCYPKELSGGERQRVALARALAPQPRLLLLDEPLSALDSPTREQLRGELRRLLTRLQIPTLLVTHDRLEALTLGDTIAVLAEGRIRQVGPVHEVFSHPTDVRVAQVVGMENVVPARVIDVQEEGLLTVEVAGKRLVALQELRAECFDGTLVQSKITSPRRLLTVPDDVFVCIRAQDVILYKEPPVGVSARNRFAGRIAGLHLEGPLVRVALDCGFPLAALVTRHAQEELALREGDTVTVGVKVIAIHLIPRSV